MELRWRCTAGCSRDGYRPPGTHGYWRWKAVYVELQGWGWSDTATPDLSGIDRRAQTAWSLCAPDSSVSEGPSVIVLLCMWHYQRQADVTNAKPPPIHLIKCNLFSPHAPSSWLSHTLQSHSISDDQRTSTVRSSAFYLCLLFVITANNMMQPTMKPRATPAATANAMPVYTPSMCLKKR